MTCYFSRYHHFCYGPFAISIILICKRRDTDASSFSNFILPVLCHCLLPEYSRLNENYSSICYFADVIHFNLFGPLLPLLPKTIPKKDEIKKGIYARAYIQSIHCSTLHRRNIEKLQGGFQYCLQLYISTKIKFHAVNVSDFTNYS